MPIARRALLAPALAIPFVWLTTLYLVPLVVGLAVGAVPLRLVSSGILFDLLAVDLTGYRILVWSPVVSGVLLSLIAHRKGPGPFGIAMSIVGATVAATLLIAGGALEIGPGRGLLIGTELRWVWRLVLGSSGLAVGLVGPVLLKAHAEDNSLDFVVIKRGMLCGGLVATILMLTLGPGPLLGRSITATASWLGSLVWVLAL